MSDASAPGQGGPPPSLSADLEPSGAELLLRLFRSRAFSAALAVGASIVFSLGLMPVEALRHVRPAAAVHAA